MATRNQNVVHILDAKIQKQRLKDMKNAASKRKIQVSDTLCPEVTYIVTEFKDYDSVLRKLGLTDADSLRGVEVVTVQWFADCMRAGKLVTVEQKHRLQRNNTQPHDEVQQSSTATPAEYGCQRATPLKHLNEKYTKALETLEKFAELRDNNHDYSRALAFRRASCVLKSLPVALQTMQQINNVTNIGGHSKRVIQEILEDGECIEVENILKDSWFQKMKIFTEIFGIGKSTANKFIDKGWTSIDQVRSEYKSGDWRVQWGLAFHEDLTTPVLRDEANYIFSMVQKHLKKVLPGGIAIVTGGFRRGKSSGHDVDILITHPTEDRIIGALPRLLHSLESTDTVLCGRLEHSTYTDDVLSRNTKLTPRGQLDHFEKWIGILKIPKKVRSSALKETAGTNLNVGESARGSGDTSNFNQTEDICKQNRDTLCTSREIGEPRTDIIYSRSSFNSNSQDINAEGNAEAEGSSEAYSACNIEGKTEGNANSVKLNCDINCDTKTEPSETKGEANGVALEESNGDMDEVVKSLDGSVDASELKSRPMKATGVGLSDRNPPEVAGEDREWLARRVDLIIAPYSQYYYALVGWTGSKQFNRDARTYSERKLNKKLSSHGLYDLTKGKKIPASSEREVFENLKLPYFEPWDRNC